MYSLPFGRGQIEVELLPGMHGTLAESRILPPVTDVPAATQDALDAPVNSKCLHEMVKPDDTVCIVVTDATRACPDALLVPPVLAELEAAGIPDDQITILVAIGMHRPSTHAEKVEKLGASIVNRYRVLDHEPQNSEQLVDLGGLDAFEELDLGELAALDRTGMAERARFTISRTVYEADLLIATGVVEPHQYAGYSGGRKTVAIGCAGEETIEFTHGPAMIDHPGTRLGNLAGNLFHAAVTAVAKRAGLNFIVNAVMDDHGQVVAVRAGEPTATFETLVGIARQLYTVPIPHAYDIVIGGAGYPKDANLYQASRVASYLTFAPQPVVRAGGVIIVPAPIPEGAGQGTGESRFYRTMRDAASPAQVIADARRYGYKPGEQRAFMMAKVLEHCQVIIAGAAHPEIVRDCHMLAAPDMDAALHMAAEIVGQNADVLVVPHALLTLPVIERKQDEQAA